MNTLTIWVGVYLILGVLVIKRSVRDRNLEQYPTLPTFLVLMLSIVFWLPIVIYAIAKTLTSRANS